MINVVWYAVFYAVVFVTGTLIAGTRGSDRMVLTGMGVAVVAGPRRVTFDPEQPGVIPSP